MQLVPSGSYGEICVKGPVVTTEYKEEPEHTKMAKIMDSDGHVWHRMGDIGYFDEEDRLWFCGRKSHRVILNNGQTLFPFHVKLCLTYMKTSNARLWLVLKAKHTSLLNAIQIPKHHRIKYMKN